MNILSIKLRIRMIISYLLNVPYYMSGKIMHGRNFSTFGRIIVKARKGQISFGDNCIIRSGISTNPLGGTNKMIIALGQKGCVKCGNNVGISNSCLRINTTLIIEDNVNIGGDCKIYDSDMHSVEYEWRIQVPDTHVRMSPIRVKEGAWIGAHSIILKGVTIGKHSIVGAGSVVTHDIPDYEIWAGNPAKLIRKIN